MKCASYAPPITSTHNSDSTNSRSAFLGSSALLSTVCALLSFFRGRSARSTSSLPCRPPCTREPVKSIHVSCPIARCVLPVRQSLAIKLLRVALVSTLFCRANTLKVIRPKLHANASERTAAMEEKGYSRHR
nr:hypothetical protein CFP56_03814 [Quercus suber]